MLRLNAHLFCAPEVSPTHTLAVIPLNESGAPRRLEDDRLVNDLKYAVAQLEWADDRTGPVPPADAAFWPHFVEDSECGVLRIEFGSEAAVEEFRGWLSRYPSLVDEVRSDLLSRLQV